ncbi:L-ascorbate metabolism protein UlaG, beta-lactamase superfamily [Stigmatella aurantiaca]|uniref:L-ascorbate metabolism protein UlaG, beta-lactamase superfamily n=1 Tax=Stigmatella aurantiaca TaxID=41 RepID=A0A1H7L0D6_STIAU|nr:MBL fold metallo-hydrolase [Stigmatella aurantiaca]SEK92452.1 L-ascorbate metabolism protein UlaG, beta-lactamase superfamily [Stigmatella aurantiaca]
MTWRRGIKRALLGLGVVGALGLAGIAASAWEPMGQAASGERRARMERSPQWKDGHFVNPQPIVWDLAGSVKGMFRSSPDVSPSRPLEPVVVPGRERFETPPASGLRVTWLGHSSVLVEVDGHRVLTDPVWSERASPLTWVGPRRWYAPPVALEDLPSIDAVVISHDHYDHLDYGTLRAMKDWDTRFIVPLGVGAHLVYWGVPPERITELDWWEQTRVGALDVVCTPARHASGRTGIDKDATLWAGYALLGPKHRVFFSGDTGLFPAMKDIGERLGPFDLTMIEVGQYHHAWPDWHIGPEQAVLAHQMLRGRALLPVHWGLFTLALHGWTEPIERVLSAARTVQDTVVLVPRPGQSLEPEAPPPLERWWPELPWVSGEEDPIVSSQMN